MHKTGTSSIQLSLQQSSDRLRDAGVAVYPGFDGGSNHGLVAYALSPSGAETRPARTVAAQRGQSPEQLLRDCLEDVEAWREATSSAEVQVISGEGFSVVSSVADEARKRFGDAEIYMYTRSPVSFARSAMQQHLQQGMTFDELKSMERLLPGYRQRLEPYIDSFGADKVHVRSFEDARESLLKNFSGWALKVTEIELEPVRVNASLCHLAAHLLEALNRQIEAYPNQVRRERLQSEAVRFVKEIPDSGDRFSPSGFDWEGFTERAAVDVEWLASYSAGEISYGRDRTPEARPTPRLNEIGTALIALISDRADERVKADIFRRLFGYAEGKDVLNSNLARQCSLALSEDFLKNAAHHFRRLGFPDDAATVERTIQLLSE